MDAEQNHDEFTPEAKALFHKHIHRAIITRIIAGVVVMGVVVGAAAVAGRVLAQDADEPIDE